MEIKCIVVGALEENCYILTEGKEAAVVDPGSESVRLIAEIEKSELKVKMILLTHGHFDHIGAVKNLAGYSGAPVYIHSEDIAMLTDNSKNLSYMTGERIAPYEGALPVKQGDVLKLGNSQIRVHYTPGHSRGCVCYEWGDNLFGGDLLFCGSIGKFERADWPQHRASLKYVMDNFTDNVKVYPGHGPQTTIGFERRVNPYITKHVLVD